MMNISVEDLNYLYESIKPRTNTNKLFMHPDNIKSIRLIINHNEMELLPIENGVWYVVDKDTSNLILTIYTGKCFNRDDFYVSFNE